MHHEGYASVGAFIGLKWPMSTVAGVINVSLNTQSRCFTNIEEWENDYKNSDSV
jgi:hypothetical protein